MPPFEAPLAPLSGEDDMSASGAIDELAVVARKMKESIPVKDRFYKMHRFTNCVLGSEVVDFLSEDKYLEREEVSCMYFHFFCFVFLFCYNDGFFKWVVHGSPMQLINAVYFS